ncbi:MAG: HNH endonuclease [Roseovarius sp.]|uniref:HNH endonuclease n=1 Tax=Roseovarius sp. TaxID=1486281 RepID=UPI0040599D1F
MAVRKEHVRHSRKITRTARWRALRMEIIERDGGACVKCGARGRLEVDHVKPVRDKPELAYDPQNLQSLCPSCHTRKTRIECGHKPTPPARRDWDMAVNALESAPRRQFSVPAGLQASRIPVNLVFGPPGAGKTTYVQDHARPDDLVIDLDRYLIALGGSPWGADKAILRAAFAAHDADLHSLAERRRGVAWLVKLAPSQAERMAWRLGLRRVQMVAILTPPDTCIQRICAEPARQERAEKMCAAVHDWWRTYSAETGENPRAERNSDARFC